MLNQRRKIIFKSRGLWIVRIATHRKIQRSVSRQNYVSADFFFRLFSFNRPDKAHVPKMSALHLRYGSLEDDYKTHHISYLLMV